MVEKFLTRKQTAELLGVHPSTLDRRWRSGEFPPPAIVLGRPMWPMADVEQELLRALAARDKVAKMLKRAA